MRLLYHGIGLYRPGQAIGPARWEHHDLIVVLSGGISLRVQGQARVLEESDGLVIPPGHLFEGGSEADQSRIWVLHYAREDGDPRGPFFIRKAPREIRKGFAAGFPRDLLDEFTDCWNATRSSGKTRFAKLLAQTLFAKVSVQLKTNTPSIPKRLQAAIHVPLSGKGPCHVSQLASRAGLGPSRFRQEFKNHLGISPSRFLRRSRMETARRLLAETSMPIKEISRQAGYSETAAFHRAFVREAGITPALFRRSHSSVA